MKGEIDFRKSDLDILEKRKNKIDANIAKLIDKRTNIEKRIERLKDDLDETR